MPIVVELAGDVVHGVAVAAPELLDGAVGCLPVLAVLGLHRGARTGAAQALNDGFVAGRARGLVLGRRRPWRGLGAPSGRPTARPWTAPRSPRASRRTDGPAPSGAVG